MRENSEAVTTGLFLDFCFLANHKLVRSVRLLEMLWLKHHEFVPDPGALQFFFLSRRFLLLGQPWKLDDRCRVLQWALSASVCSPWHSHSSDALRCAAARLIFIPFFGRSRAVFLSFNPMWTLDAVTRGT